MEAKKPVQESLVRNFNKSFTKVEKHTGNMLALFQNRVPLMGGWKEGDHSRSAGMKSILIIGL